jgi:membrane protein
MIQIKALTHTVKTTFKNISIHFGTIVGAIGRDFMTGTLPLRATSLVYTTILSIVPLLALSFSVLKGFGVHNQLAPFLNKILAPLGEKGIEVSGSILLFVDNIKVGVLGAIGLGFLLYTVVALIQKIEAAFNSIWHIDKPRPHVQRFTSYLSVITVGPILLFSMIGLKTKFTTNPLIADTLGIATTTGFMPQIVAVVSTFAMPVFLFTLLNKAVPHTKVKWIPAIIAGFVTTFLWQAVAQGFGTFMVNSGNYDAIYSSFAIILLVFIWLYLNWLIILIGGSLCFYIQNPEQSKFSLRRMHLHQQDKLYQALLIIKTVYQKFEKGENPLTLRDAGKMLGSDVFAKEIITPLSQANILHCDEQGKEEIVLIKSLEKISLYDVMNGLNQNQSRINNKKKKDEKIIKSLQKMDLEWKNKSIKEFI